MGFDLLRGLCALGVASYHMMIWLYKPQLRFAGIYGVYIFFILSGASIYVAYSKRISTDAEILKFLWSRVFRLVPLYLAVISLSWWAYNKPLNTAQASLAGLNASLLFGLGNPGDTSTVTGGWSLGIEFLFYLLFPVFAVVTKSRVWWIVAIILFIAQRVFIEHVLAVGTLADNWTAYIQFLSFAYYFFIGCCIGRASSSRILNNLRLPPIALVAVFVGFAVVGSTDPEHSLRGILGAGLALGISLLVLLSVLAKGGRITVQIAETLGMVSYGVYLLHPILFVKTDHWVTGFTDNIYVHCSIVLLLSLIAAWLSNKYFEMPMRAIGNRLLSRWRAAPGVL